MGSYRPPQHGYGPPPTQDPYARPGSTSYNQPPAGVHGYGPQVTNAPPAWNTSNQYAQTPLPPPPPTAPPTDPSPYGYQIQTVGGQTVTPVVPPRIPQPYNQSTSTTPGPQSYQAPPTPSSQLPGHQRAPSVPSAYHHQEVSQNNQGWPQHPQYSNQPTTHHYDPPRLPLRPGTAPRPEAEQHGSYAHPPPPPPPAQYPGATQYQHHPQGQGQGQGYEPSPSSSSVYSPDEQPLHQSQPPQDPYQRPMSYVPPPPPPKPDGYGAGQGYPGYEQQPPRPASISQPYGQHYQQTPPPQSAPYPGAPPPPPSSQYGQEHTGQYQTYGASQPPNANSGYPQPPPPQQYHQPQDHASQYPPPGRQTPMQPSSRPGSKPQPAHGYGRPPSRSDDTAPVSPLQSRQSISFERPSSTVNANANANANTSAPQATGMKPPKTSFTFSSDWEHFGSGADEIDDTAMYGVKKDAEQPEAKMASVELPASSPIHGRAPSEVSAPESFHPSPAVAPAVQHAVGHSVPQNPYVPTPPTGGPTAQQHQPISAPTDEADYIPPMPNTPPAATRPARSSIVIGGTAQSQTAPPAAPAFVMDSGAYQSQAPGGYQMQHAPVQPKPPTPQPQLHAVAAHPPSTYAPHGQVAAATSWDQAQQAQGNVASMPAPSAPAFDPAQLRKAQQEAEDYKAELSHLQQELLNIRATTSEKDALLAQRDSTITQKDAAITQKDTEIAERTTHLNELKASLAEITETFGALRTSTSGLEAQVKAAEAAQVELKAKVEQGEAAKGDLTTRLEQSVLALTAASTKHDGEKKELGEKLKDAQTKLEQSSAKVTELEKQLEEAKTKAEEKAAEPVDIAPGLDAWFKGSLERCKDMLYTESKPIPVQEKLQVFMDFVNAEARLRGIDMPFGPKGEVKGFNATVQVKEAPKQERPRITPPKESDGFVMVDSDADVQYSPGGRPILNAAPVEAEFSPGGRPILKQTRSVPAMATAPPRPEKAPTMPVPSGAAQKPAYQPFRGETPGSNASSKGPAPAPLTSAPSQPPKPAYQPFSAAVQGSSTAQPPQGPIYQSLYKPNPAAGSGPTNETPKKNVDHDIFFDPVPGARARNSNDSIKSPQDQHMLPMPLKPRTPAPPLSTAVADTNAPAELPVVTSPQKQRQNSQPGVNALEKLRKLFHLKQQTQNSKRIQELSTALDALSGDYAFIKALGKSWEDKTAITRSQLAKERAQRQADIEKRNNELFDNGEIGYGDLETLESEAKEEELRSKATEDEREYESYSKEVFDVVYKRCHEDIGALVRLQTDGEGLLHNAHAGHNAVQGGESVSQVLDFLLKTHDKSNAAHAEVTKAIQERDRKYKLTQTKALYAAGDITAMKRVEKACEESERKAEVRARVERAERCKRVHRIVDAEMERGAGENEDVATEVIELAEAAIREGHTGDVLLPLLEKAAELVRAVYEDTQSLMRCFATIDAELNDCEYEVSVASARHKGDPKEYFDRLEVEKKREDGKLKEDAEKRAKAVREHMAEAEAQVMNLMSRASEPAEEREARVRKERALEEARRRNGAV